jgi:hypothetical protein
LTKAKIPAADRAGKKQPGRPDFIGANRDEVALAAVQTDISLENVVMAMKNPD